MTTGNYHCWSSALSKDSISDVMWSESEDSEDLNKDVVIVEGNRDSDSACELEATQSPGTHELLACVSRVQQNWTDMSLDSSYFSSSSYSTVTVGSNPSNLMCHLWRATSLKLSRKWVIDCDPLNGKKCCKGLNSSDPKSVIPQQHVKRYVNEWRLTVSIGKLFCVACREQLSLKCSVINHHVTSSKCSAGKARMKNKQWGETELVEARVHNVRERGNSW